MPVSATPPASQLYSSYSQGSNGLGLSQSSAQSSGLSKYAQLLAVIEEMGRDIRPTYAMGRGDRLKRLIIQAKVKHCCMTPNTIINIEWDHLSLYFRCSFESVLWKRKDQHGNETSPLPHPSQTPTHTIMKFVYAEMESTLFLMLQQFMWMCTHF